MTRHHTRDEQIASQIARCFKPGEQIGTTTFSNVVLVGLALAQRMYDPDMAVYMESRGTGAILTAPGLKFPFMAGYPPLDAVEAPLTSMEIFALLVAGRWNMFMNPAQIDQYGNMNISVIGDWKKPTAALVGARGVPDNSVNGARVYYFVTEHSKRSFVEKVDFICGVGYGPERKQGIVKWGAVQAVFSDLGVFDFDERSGRMRIKSLHTGVTLEEVRERTGFELIVPRSVPETDAPSDEELRLLREVVDPAGIRRLDFLKGDDYKKAMDEIQKGTTYSKLYMSA